MDMKEEMMLSMTSLEMRKMTKKGWSDFLIPFFISCIVKPV